MLLLVMAVFGSVVSASTPECDNVLEVFTDKRGRLYTPIDFPYLGGKQVEFQIKTLLEKSRLYPGQEAERLQLILIDGQPIDDILQTRIYYPQQRQNQNPIIAKVEWNDQVYCANDPGDELGKNIMSQRFRFYWNKK